MFLPLAFCAIAMQHSRSNYLAFAVLLGLILVNSFTQLRGWPRGLAGKAAAIFALALSVMLVYMSMGAVSARMTTLSRATQETPAVGTCADGEPDAENEIPAELFNSAGTRAGEEFVAANESPAELSDPAGTRASEEFVASNESPTELFDSRNTLADSWTLTGRIGIWRAGLLTIRENPSIALIGQPVESVMTRINQIVQIVDEPKPHMHNALMQQLMTSGVPGMVIYCLLFFSLLKKIALDVCHRGKKKGVMQPLEALLLALLVYSMFEPLLYKSVPVSSLLFCLSAGLIDAGLQDPS